MSEGEEQSGQDVISGFMGGAKGSGGASSESFENAAETAHENDPDSFLDGATETHWSNPDVDTPPPASDTKKG